MAMGEPQASLTPSMEDYLKVIYQLRERGERGTICAIAEALQISSPSVTNMVKRLCARGLLIHSRYQDVSLTPAGERISRDVVRRHLVVEQFLTHQLGLSDAQACAEAERLEHVLSGELESRMLRLINAAQGAATRSTDDSERSGSRVVV
jgi:DtxR family Mn-dependent transcriptional regulator